MTAKKIQPTNPSAATSDAKDAGDKTSTRKTATAKSSHRTSGRKTAAANVKH